MSVKTKQLFTSGEGIRLKNESGEEYIDVASGTFNLSLGYNYPYVVNKLQQQLGKLTHMSSHFTEPYVEEVLRLLLDVAPKGINDGWMRDITGSTANECAIKIAQKYTGARDVISLYLSHHGQTQFTTGISGNAFRKKHFINSSYTNHLSVPAPYCYRCPFKSTYPECGFMCLEAINDSIEYSGSGSVSCLIIEPIIGNGGNIVPPKGYFTRLRELCNNHNILLIADEVQTGIGRTGYMFSSELFEINPDIITLAKGLGGIGVPVGSVLMRSEYNVLEKYEHSFTSGSNLLSLTAAKATLEILSSDGFLDKVKTNGMVLGDLLHKTAEKFTFIGDVRGVGLMWGIEIIKEDGSPDVEKTNQIIEEAFVSENLILRGSRYGFGNVVKIRPSLITSLSDIYLIIERLDRVLQKLL